MYLHIKSLSRWGGVQSTGIIIATVMAADVTSPQEDLVVITFSPAFSNHQEY